MPRVKGKQLAGPWDFIFARLSLSRGQIWDSCGKADARVPGLRGPKCSWSRSTTSAKQFAQSKCLTSLPKCWRQLKDGLGNIQWNYQAKDWTDGGKYFFTQHIIKLWTPNSIVEVPVAGCAGVQADPAPAGVSRAPGGWAPGRRDLKWLNCAWEEGRCEGSTAKPYGLNMNLSINVHKQEIILLFQFTRTQNRTKQQRAGTRNPCHGLKPVPLSVSAERGETDIWLS